MKMKMAFLIFGQQQKKPKFITHNDKNIFLKNKTKKNKKQNCPSKKNFFLYKRISFENKIFVLKIIIFVFFKHYQCI